MLYILLPVHNRKEITKKFICSLKKQTVSNYHLVVIDDGSTDGTSEMITEELPSATILRGNGELWWAGSLQKGFDWFIKNANNDDLVLIINDDVVICPDYLEIGSKLLDENIDAIIGSISYSMQTNEKADSGIRLLWNPLRFLRVENSKDINCFSTRGIFLKLKTIKKIGGLHHVLLPHYLSDYEYTHRAVNKGIQIITNNNLYLYKNEKTTGFGSIKYKNVKDFLNKYFSKRNPNNIFYYISFILLAAPSKIIFNEMIILLKKQYKLLFNNIPKLLN